VAGDVVDVTNQFGNVDMAKVKAHVRRILSESADVKADMFKLAGEIEHRAWSAGYNRGLEDGSMDD
jgi:hypothetical protein